MDYFSGQCLSVTLLTLVLSIILELLRNVPHEDVPVYSVMLFYLSLWVHLSHENFHFFLLILCHMVHGNSSLFTISFGNVFEPVKGLQSNFAIVHCMRVST